MKKFIAIAALLFATSLHADDKPNIVFFLIDDLGYMDLGCYGSTFYETPHIDALAASGARFTNAYAACPVCSPTRASIMTGKYPARMDTTDWFGAGQPEEWATRHQNAARRLHRRPPPRRIHPRRSPPKNPATPPFSPENGTSAAKASTPKTRASTSTKAATTAAPLPAATSTPTKIPNSTTAKKANTCPAPRRRNQTPSSAPTRPALLRHAVLLLRPHPPAGTRSPHSKIRPKSRP